IATERGTPARSRFLTAVLRKSCRMRPGTPASMHAWTHTFNDRVERDEDQAPTHGLVDIADRGSVIADDDDLVCWRELEEVLPHVPGADGVASGQVLDLRLGEPPALLGLGGDSQALAAKIGEIRWMLITSRRHQSFHDQAGDIVVAEGAAYGLHEFGFA